MPEEELGAVVTDDSVDDSTAAEPEVVDDQLGAGAEEDAAPVDRDPEEPEADPWEGVSWRHRQAAERQKQGAEWAKAVGPEVMEGLVETQNDWARKYAALGRQEAPGGQQVAPEAASPAPDAAKPAVPAAPREFAFDMAALEEGMEVPDSFKNGVLMPQQEYNRSVVARLAKMEAYYEQSQQREQEQHLSRTLESLDTFVASPEMADLQEVYGVGPTNALDMNGAPAKARAELAGFALSLQRGLAGRGQPMNIASAFALAKQVINSDRIAAAERDKGRKEADVLKRTATRRPATRNVAPEEKTDNEQRSSAVDFVRGWLKRKGK